MPLEDLIGDKYVSNLNEIWPLGTDLPDSGDDHLRGIKNVLKKTFPNLSGAVTRTHTDLNNGSVPAGSLTVFWQATAPIGWSRYGGLASDFMLRVVKSSGAGGGYGGTDSPILNYKVPSHNHDFSGTSQATTASHTHTASSSSSGSHNHGGNTGTNGAHSHQYTTRYSDLGFTAGGIAAWTGQTPQNTTIDGDHQHSIYSDGAHTHTVTVNSGGASHTHGYSGTTAVNASADNWAPRYLDAILCQKS